MGTQSYLRARHGLTAARAQQVQLNVPGQAAPAAAPAFSESQIVEEFGWFIGKRVGLTELDFSAPEIAAFLKGVSAAAAGKESPYTLEKIGPLMDEFMQKKQTAYLGKLKQMWINLFLFLGQVAYGQAEKIITLYSGNATTEVEFGADEKKFPSSPTASSRRASTRSTSST